MKARVTGLLLGMASVTGTPTAARAVPGEWALGGELGAGRSTRSTWSPSFGLRGAYGFAEALDVQVELSGQWLRSKPAASGEGAVFRLVPALVYKFDVLRWVPFVRLGAGPTLGVPLSGERSSRLALGVQGGLGVDYLLERSWSVGVAYQADWAVGASEFATSMAPMHRGLLNVSWRSGW